MSCLFVVLKSIISFDFELIIKVKNILSRKLVVLLL